MRKLLPVLVAVLCGITMAATPSAQAAVVDYTISHFAENVNNFTVNCEEPSSHLYNRLVIYYGQSSETYTPIYGCDYFSVGWGARILYKSNATGVEYWTACGEDEAGIEQGFGWAHVGNSVTLLMAARYPDAPAQTCDGRPG